jgi:hypothetical protein
MYYKEASDLLTEFDVLQVLRFFYGMKIHDMSEMTLQFD